MHILLLFASYILKIVAVTKGPEFLVLESFKDLYLVNVSRGLQAGFEQTAPINPPSHRKLPNSDLALPRSKGMEPHSAFLGQLSGSRPRTPNCLSSTSKMTV